MSKKTLDRKIPVIMPFGGKVDSGSEMTGVCRRIVSSNSS